MLTQAQLNVGQSVILRSDSQWSGKGVNPAALTQGTISSIDGEWINVRWNGSEDVLNYRSYDLDAV